MVAPALWDNLGMAKKKKKALRGPANPVVEVSPKPNSVVFYNPGNKRLEQTDTMRRSGRRRKEWTDERLLSTPWSRLTDESRKRQDLADEKLALVAPGGVAAPGLVHDHDWHDVPNVDAMPRQKAVNHGRWFSKSPEAAGARFRVTAVQGSNLFKLQVSPKFCADCSPSNANRSEEPPSSLPL